MTTPFTLTFDCASPARLAAFWCEALGYVAASPPAGFDSWEQWLRHFAVPEDEWDDGTAIEDPSGLGPRISFLRVPEPKTAKNRVHLDVQAGGGRAVPWETRWPRVQAKVAALVTAGATVQAEVDLDGRPDHVVLTDPEGNELCVV
ncbi:VOC family protein [Dactylosporangium darangshiense]|uniref:VOC family protein n=1 Tax=Dactylosporangium darangshiense TaxID=579108 RepID=A0ABP8DKV2_9ACTN